MKVESTNVEIKHETPTCGKRVLPAVFRVNSFWGNGKLSHLGTHEKLPLCGSKLQSAELSETEVKFENGDLLEFWNQAQEVQEPKWVRVMEYEYCKRCLSVLNGR